jgi:hypothetical protein
MMSSVSRQREHGSCDPPEGSHFALGCAILIGVLEQILRLFLVAGFSVDRDSPANKTSGSILDRGDDSQAGQPKR